MQNPVVLVEKISDAVGGIAKPWQIKRVAKAEAKADLVRAEARISISELEERALRRMVAEEARKQANIESITEKTIPFLSEKSRPEDLSPDWIVNLFDKAKLISDQQMQDIWAKILAEEANSPGLFSKKTIEILASLDRADALLFAKVRRMTWNLAGPLPIIFDLNKPCKFDEALDFLALHHLDDLGLVNLHPGMGFAQTINADINVVEQIEVSYFGTTLFIQARGGSDIRCGCVMLTNSGKQILPLCESEPSQEYFEDILEFWIASNYLPYSNLP